MKLTQIVGRLCAQLPTQFLRRLSLCLGWFAVLLALSSVNVRAANIVWVSDTPNSNGTAIVSWNTTSPVTGTNLDDGFITLLQGAGHNVVRFTSDDNTATSLTAGDITALNTNDLIIIGRATGSGMTTGAQGVQWNTAITKPMIVQSSFLTRSNNFGWFTNAAPIVVNGVPQPITALSGNAKASYLFNLFNSDVAGLTTVSNYDEALMQNTSQTSDNPAVGATILASGFGTNRIIVEFPAGTPVRGGNLGGYRLFFSSGNRESGTAPSNTILFAGAENLTPTGEKIFLRAVALAANGGVVPNSADAPVITQNPAANSSVCVGLPLTLTSAATGANPLFFRWFNGATFVTGGTNATLRIASFQNSDAGNYTVVVSNAVGGLTAVTSSVAVVSISGTGTVINPIANRTSCPGDTTTFTATATGSGTLQYTWYKGATPVQGPNGVNTFTLSGITAADAATYSVAVSGDCNIATNTFTLTVVGTPTVTTQPANSIVPMGNGETFTVAATATGATPSYQWQTNGVDVTGATATSLVLTNVPLSMNGTLIRVIASTCAGSITSQVATLTVIPQSGISFDFNTPGQFTNTPYYLTYNNWFNNANATYPLSLFEKSSAGVGNPPGSGALDASSAQGTDVQNVLIPISWDFTQPGRQLTAVTYFKFKTPVTAARRATQFGFVTATNYGVNDNNPQEFMAVMLQSPTANSPLLEFRTQQRRTTNGGNFESVFNQATLTPSNWYKLSATFINSRTGAAGDTNFSISAYLQDMGPLGTTPGVTNMQILTSTNSGDFAIAGGGKRMYLAIRSFEDGGVDLRDNTYVYTTNGPIFFVQEPQSQTVVQGQHAMFKAYVDGEGPYSYQWYKNGSPIAGAKSWNYFPIVTSADNGAQYLVEVTGPDATVILSSPAILTVSPLALGVVSVGSVDGTSVGIKFNQPVDPTTAQNPANYSINGVAPVAANVFRTSVGPQGNDGIYVVLTPASVVAGAFTVNVSGVQDLAGNVISGATSGNGNVINLTGLDVNSSTFPPGSHYAFADGDLIVGGGGADIWANFDQFHFLYAQRTGDFDIKVRVPYMDYVRPSSKAGLHARVDLSTFSPMINVAANPMGNLATGTTTPVGVFGRNYIEGAVRMVPNNLPGTTSGSTSWGNTYNQTYPNVWIRLRRSGNTFIRYESTNGVNWTIDGQVNPNPAFPATLYVGLAVCSAANDNLETAQFENFGNFGGYPGSTIAITTQPAATATAAAGANVTLSGLVATATGGGITQSSELTYNWQRTNTAVGGWTNVLTSGQTNENSLVFGPVFGNDNGAQFRCVLTAPGANSVTSSVVTITVTDTAAPTVTSTINGTIQNFYPVSEITITYSEPVAGASALNIANYAVTNSAGVKLTVTNVYFLNGDPRTVVVQTSEPLGAGTNVTVGISGVRDLNNVQIATVTRTFRSFGAPFGPVVVEYFTDIGGSASVNDLVRTNLYTNNQPTWIVYSNLFGVNVALNGSTFPGTTYSGGTVAADNYGVKAYTYFVPPTNGNYKFWIRSDDGMRLYMNTNSTDIIIPTSRNSPNGQDVYTVMDGNVNTKYLNFDKVNTGFTITRFGSGAVVQGLRFTTAGDAPERDPITYTLEGTTGDPRFGPWTLISSGGTGFTNGITRLTRADFVPVANATAYTAYRLIFPTLQNVGTANSMQIAEVEFLDANTNKVLFGPQIIAENSANVANYTNGSVVASAVTNINLVGGKKYYMEVLLKEGGGSDGFSVMWSDPTSNAPMANTVFIPYANLDYPAEAAAVFSPVKVITEMYLGYINFAAPGNPSFNTLAGIADSTNFPTDTYVGSVANFKYIAGNPDFINYQKFFGFQTLTYNTRYDAYLGKAYSYFVPPTNGVYKFWARVDDVCSLYMNTNAVNSTDPYGKKLIGNSLTPFQSGAPYMLVGSNLTLNAGQKYYMEVLWKEGTGGDGFALAVRANGDNTQPSATAVPEVIPDTMLEFPTNISRSGQVALDGIAGPQGGTNFAFVDGTAPVLVAQGLHGAPPYLGFSWYKNGVKILDNAFTNYMAPLTAADNNAVITLVVTNLFSSAQKSITLTVLPDATAPTIVSTVGSRYGDTMSITFSEPVDPASATYLGNYIVNNGLRLLSATVDRSGRMVVFQTSQQTAGTLYTVVVNGVKDRSSVGNTVALNTTVQFSGWVIGGNNAYLVEYWTNIVGGTIPDLTGYAKFIAGQPDLQYYTNVFGIGTFNANNGLENYGARISGYFIPTNTGYYKFFAACDDQAQFFMNLDSANSESPAGRTLLIHVPGANQGFTNANAQSQPVYLNQGQRYYMEALLKEGTGGDYLKMMFRQTDANGAFAGLNGFETASTAATELIPGLYGGGVPGNPDLLQITATPPSDVNAIELDPITLQLVANIPTSIRAVGSLQWQRSAGGGTFTNIPGAVNLSYSFTALLSQDGSQYRLIASFPGLSNVFTTTLHVSPDNQPPLLVGAGSLDGKKIALRFNKPVDLDTSTQPLSYDIDGGIFETYTPINGGLGTRLLDEKTIVFTLDPAYAINNPIPASFTANEYYVPSQATTPVSDISSTPGGTVYLTPMEVGVPGSIAAGGYNAAMVGFPGVYNNGGPVATVFPDSAIAVTNNGVDVTANGWDIWNNADSFQFNYRQIAGDFDIKVRVQSLIGADQWSKAGLMARSDLTNTARNVFAGVTPTTSPILSQVPQNNYIMQWRDADNTASGNFQSGVGTNPPTYPNAWVRLKRVGNNFISYMSSNNVDWVLYTNHVVPTMPSVVYVGLASVSHDQTRSLANNARVEYRDLYFPLAPTITTQPSPDNIVSPIHQNVTFSGVVASGIGPFAYQWLKNGTPMPNETNASLTLTNVGVVDSATFRLIVGNDGGGVLSSNLTLVVSNALPVVNTDSIAVSQNTSSNMTPSILLGNDSDPEGDALSILAVSGVAPVTFFADFNAGAPTNMTLFPVATILPSGGNGNSGVLQLNSGVASVSGSAILNELTPRKRVSAFTASFLMRVSETSAEAADGFSFNFAPDLPLAATTPFAAEAGGGTGFTFYYDSYRFLPAPTPGSANSAHANTTANTSGFGIVYNGINITSVQVPTWNSTRYVPVTITVSAAGVATVMVDGTNVFGNVTLPSYTPKTGQFGFYGRTGGSFEAHYVDDLSITVMTLDTASAVAVNGALYGNAYYASSGGVSGTGSLHLNDNINAQSGSFVLNDLNGGAQVTGFDASFKLRIGDNSADGADGMSFNFSGDLPNGTSGGAEAGVGTNLSLCIFNYPGTGSTNAPSFQLKRGGVLYAIQNVPKWNSTAWVPVTVHLDPDGTVDVTVGGSNVFVNVATGYIPSAGRFGFYARTGGQNETHWVDDLVISSTATNGPSGYFANDFNSTGPGTVSLVGGNVVYNPGNLACGNDTFYYLVSDGQQGGTVQGSVNVVVNATNGIAPAITCPASFSIMVAGSTFALPDVRSGAIASGNCISISQSPLPGTVLPVGAQTVTLTVTDANNVSQNCQLTVTGVDTSTPVPLFVTQSGTNVVITWISTPAHSLYETSDLNPPITWTPSSATVLSSGGTNTATIPATNAAKFYQLK